MPQHRFHLVFARRSDGPPPLFLRALEYEVQRRGLTFFHCQNHEQAELLEQAVMCGELQIDCLVDYMGRSFRNDVSFARAVRESGGMVVDDPDLVRIYGNKARMHIELANAGVTLPRTIIWPGNAPDRDLTLSEQAYLGPRIVGKPSHGSGAYGVQLDLEPTAAGIAALRDGDDDDYLLQEFVQPIILDGQPAWFRVYNCFGQVFLCFWHPETHATTFVNHEQYMAYGLSELVHISQTIAAITGYRWFSSEIALTIRDGQRVALPIDYLNNKCFMLTHGEVGAIGMPEALALAVANAFAEHTLQHVLMQTPSEMLVA